MGPTFACVILAVVAITSIAATPLIPPFKEECLTKSFPPDSSRSVPTHEINLDLPPNKRWAEVSKLKSKEMEDLFVAIQNLTTPFFHGKFIQAVDLLLPLMVDTLPYPFDEELRGMAEASGLEQGKIALLNVFYEIFTVCTSIVAQDKSGKLFHGRNLDFGLFLGWDVKTHNWKIPELLRPLVANLVFKRSGKVVFKGVNFIGYVGILTAIKPQTFTMTMNERFQLDGGFVGIAEWLMGRRKGQWMGFLTRSVMENATSFAEAKKMLTDTEMLAPAYFILGGNSSGEAVIITRGRTDANTLKFGNWTRDWYLLQTNYDHWQKPMFIDDRRTPGMACMDKKGQNASASIHGLFNVLSSQPMLNKLTTYVALMQVNDGTLHTYLQNCTQITCWGW